MAHALIALN